MQGIALTTETANVVRVAPTLDAEERAKSAFLADAAACIEQNGLVILENVIPKPVIDGLLDYFKKTYDAYMREGQRRLYKNHQDDPLRAQIPVAPAGAVVNPIVVANPYVMALVKRFIGEQAIIGEMGAIVSHPGSKPQYAHRDSTYLFGGLPSEIDLPPHSLNIIVPLMDVPLERGPTEFWPGSHKRPEITGATTVPPQRVPMRAGSLFMLDGRLLHRGGPNCSDVVRPAIYIDYQRPWYVERSGYTDKPQVRVTPAMLKRLPPEHQRLFAWALHLNRADTFDEFVTRWVSRLRAHVLEPLARRR